MVAVRIPLINTDAVARVSIQDAAAIMAFKWRARKSRYTFYAVRSIGRGYYITMQEMVLSKGCDHIDRNGLNNIRSNLRPATLSQQRMNAPIQRNNTSGHRGVSWNRIAKKWHASIQKDRVVYNLGYFANLDDAAAARRAAAQKLYGEYAAEHERS